MKKLVGFLIMSIFLRIFAVVMVKDSTKNRDAALRQRFDEIQKSGINSKYYDWKVVVKLIAKMPAPRFYITPKMAEQYVLNYYRGIYKVKSMLGKEMIKDLVENYERLKQEDPYKQAWEIWQDLVECPAKSFYLREKTIKYIIYEYLRPTDARAHRRRG